MLRPSLEVFSWCKSPCSRDVLLLTRLVFALHIVRTATFESFQKVVRFKVSSSKSFQDEQQSYNNVRPDFLVRTVCVVVDSIELLLPNPFFMVDSKRVRVATFALFHSCVSWGFHLCSTSVQDVQATISARLVRRSVSNPNSYTRAGRNSCDRSQVASYSLQSQRST